jgi:murein L,D-transpeptidase YcbB/YkuD
MYTKLKPLGHEHSEYLLAPKIPRSFGPWLIEVLVLKLVFPLWRVREPVPGGQNFFPGTKGRKTSRRAGAGLGLSLLLLSGPTAAAETPVTESLRLQLQELSADRQTSRADLAAEPLLARVYEHLGFAIAWSQLSQMQSLIDAVVASASDGLNPDDYHLDRIRHMYSRLEAGETLSPADHAAFDLLLTDSLIRLACHQRFGKIDSETLKPRWSFSEQIGGKDPVAAILRIIGSGSVTAQIQNLLPRNDAYRRLQSALESYRKIAGSGGWPRIADGPTLQPGTTDDRLDTLARRLQISGDLSRAGDYTDNADYDDTLRAAVYRFQARHGLEVDGLVGARTSRALNVSAEARVEQLRVNLERARWILDALADESVLVNIAGFQAYLVRSRSIVWNSKVQVGDPDHETPIIASLIERLVFNPKWTVPRSIATQEMLPEIKKDSRFFDDGNYELYDRDGFLVDPYDVDWNEVTKSNFRYTIVQRPGSANALGRIKFEFSNEYSVYLHDTPNKALFESAQRACTHGCIRLESPLDLATILLQGSGWQYDELNALIAGTETRTVTLTKPVPILIQYWTAEVDSEGTIYFYDDIYDRDRSILNALNSRYPGNEYRPP